MARAIQMSSYGDPSVLQVVEVELPPLKASEIRLQTLAASVNRADLEIRSGKWPILQSSPFPYTPGLEVLGDVVEVGAEVTEAMLGQRVITMMQKLGGIHGIRPGGYQEFVTVEADAAAVIPRDLDPLAVASLGLAAVTAYNGIKRLDLKAGQSVVIHGASGGVGSVGLSIAKALGATTIATTSNRSKDEYLRLLGADQVIHLREDRLIDVLEPRSIDAVLETLGEQTFKDSVAVLRRGGSLCLVGALTGDSLSLSAWDLIQELHLTGYSSENLTGSALRQDMHQICEWLRLGRIVAPPFQTFPLTEAAQAHWMMEQSRLVGRALLVPTV